MQARNTLQRKGMIIYIWKLISNSVYDLDRGNLKTITKRKRKQLEARERQMSETSNESLKERGVLNGDSGRDNIRKEWKVHEYDEHSVREGR